MKRVKRYLTKQEKVILRLSGFTTEQLAFFRGLTLEEKVINGIMRNPVGFRRWVHK